MYLALCCILSVVSSLVHVDATSEALDDAALLPANWMLELLDECANVEQAIGTKISHEDIESFQAKVAKPFISHLKGNISNHFSSSGDVLSALSISNPRKVRSLTSDELSCYGETSINTLLKHYGSERSTETLQGEITVRDIRTEWKTFLQFMAKQPKSDMKSELKELQLTETLKPTVYVS